MNKLFTTIALIIITLYASFASQPPAITLAPLLTRSFCVGSSASIGFTADGYPSGHIYAVQLSDANGNFSGTPTVLGTGQSSPITFTLPSYSSGTTNNYVLRIIDQNDNTRVSGSSSTIYFGTLNIKLQTVSGESSSTYICNGSSVKLYANVNFPDNNGFTYYWYKDGSSLPIGTSSDSYTTNQSGIYQVRTQKYGCDGFTSTNTFTISNISNLSGESLLYKNNFSPYQCVGTTLPFKSVYEAENATYQWQKDGVVIPGQTKSILNITQSGTYTLTVNDANCSAPSSYTLTKELTFSNVIHSLISSSPSNVINDSVAYCANNQNVSLQHNNSFSNSSSYSYQWKKNGIDVNGATQYGINNVPEGIYSLKITQGNCSTISKSINVVRKTTSSKIIKSYGTRGCVGDNITIFIDGLTCSSYQWQKDGIDIPMALNPTFYANQSGSYCVKIIENGITYFSNSINITISDAQSFVISQLHPNYNDCTNSKYYYFSDPGLYMNNFFQQGSFQWYKDDVIINGATNYSYAITNSGTYKLRVTKGSCSGFSQNAEVIIPNTNPEMSKPQISSNNGFLICNGSYTNLQASYFSNANYEWKRNGQTILNGLMKYSLDIMQSGNYTVTVTKSLCTATSDPFTINIGDKQQSIKNSNWNDATMWSCGTVPTIAEDALINKGHTISIPNNYTGFVKDLQVNGVLRYGNNALLKFRTN